MMENICEVCKKNIAIITIDGKHNYCMACHNKIALDRIGIEDTFKHARNISVVEPGGIIHDFEIEHLVLGGIVSWEAKEIGGEYKFKLISDAKEEGAHAAKKLFRKIVEGVCTKTIEDSNSKWGMFSSLKSKGTIRIIEDEERDFKTGFEIDGKKYTPDELAKLLSSYPDFNLVFQIRDGSDPILAEDEYLTPIRITSELLLQELETALAVTTDSGGFLSYKNMPAFDEFFDKILEKLRILDDAMMRPKAQEIGKAIAKRLSEVESDDDWFPIGNIQCICNIVDPFGTDEELYGYMENE